MQPEQQIQPPVPAPEIAPQPQSTPIKKQHGGKRAGAGRKPDLVKRMVSRLTPATAREVLATVDVEKVIKEIFSKGSLTLKQRTLVAEIRRLHVPYGRTLSIRGLAAKFGVSKSTIGDVLAGHNWRRG